MQQILAATDFSTRSERAVRRARLLAKQASASLTLVHVVDDDRPQRLVAAEQREASALLDEMACSIRETDGLVCETKLMLGEPFQGITQAANDTSADLIVMGPHRRQILRDVFVGTTVERTIRRSQRPVIMANAEPSGPYRRIMLAVDFSESSAGAIRMAKSLGFLESTVFLVMHAFDAPAQTMMLLSGSTMNVLRDYLSGEEGRARDALSAFCDEHGLSITGRVVRLIDNSAAEAIRASAQEQRADLIIVGTHGQSGLAKLLLGSVAESVLRAAVQDVLAVPYLSRSCV